MNEENTNDEGLKMLAEAAMRRESYVDIVSAQAEYDAAKTRYFSTGKDYLLYVAWHGILTLYRERYKLAKENRESAAKTKQEE